MKKLAQVFKVDLKAGKVSKSYFIDTETFVLGRGDASAIKIDDHNVSREHLKVQLDSKLRVCVQDLGSSNGTYIGNKKIVPHILLPITEKDTIEFSKSKIKIKISLFSVKNKTEEFENEATSIDQINNFKVEINGFTETENELKRDYKNLNIEIPSDKTALEHSSEIIKEAEFIRHRIITNANSEKEKILAETRLASKRIADETYRIYLENSESLLIETKKRIDELKAETKVVIEQKQIYIHQEIERLWQKHDENIELDKNRLLEKINLENQLKLDLNLEQQNSQIFIEKERIIAQTDKEIFDKQVEHRKNLEIEYIEYKNKLIEELKVIKNELSEVKKATELHLIQRRQNALIEIEKLWQAHQEQSENEKKNILKVVENENKIKLELMIEKAEKDTFLKKEQILREADVDIELKTKKYKLQFELNQSQFEEKYRISKLELENIQDEIKTMLENNLQLKIVNSERANLGEELADKIKVLTEQFSIAQSELNHIYSERDINLKDLESYKKSKETLLLEKQRLEIEVESLTKSISLNSEKKNALAREITEFDENFQQIRLKNKIGIETEFSELRKKEQVNFDKFKSYELKELQNIREQHTQSIKKLSIDLSQEITTTLELQSKKQNSGVFNFEKNFELVNSIIQVKSAAVTGSESKHKDQLDNWKKRQKMEKNRLILTGFASAFVFYFSVNFIYSKLTQDSRQNDLKELADSRQKKEFENAYVPIKTDQFYEDYVRATIYTKNFSEIYLNEDNQKEWVHFATLHFLKIWKVPEENIIQVISNSKSLVQNIQETIPKLKKDRLKKDIENLTLLEKNNIEEQAQILGTFVKYEAYKKLEKDFFMKKTQLRNTASEK